jgi:hypothetical protein
MSFFTYKNTKLLLNGIPYYANNASLSEIGAIEPSYIIDNKNSNNYVAENGIGGSLRFSYLLTGQDSLVDNISSEDSIISGNFGGLYFQSGYLRSYGFTLEPNNPVTVNAEIVFFDSISGNFSPNYEIAPELLCLNVANATVYDAPGNSVGTINNVTNLNYSYNIDIHPQYNIGQTIPERVVFGQKEVNVDITSDKTNAFLPVSGQTISLRAKLTHPVDSTISQNFDCKGILFQKEFNVGANNILVNKISIRQNNLADFNLPTTQNVNTPKVYYLSPNTGYDGTSVNIYGKNLNDVDYVSFGGNVFDYNFQVINDTQLVAAVPPEAIGGEITLYSKGGSTISRDKFYVGGKEIVIDDLIAVSGLVNSSILISGDNFYEISRVLFNNNQTGIFNVINKNLISAIIPNNAAWGFVDVISDIFNLSGRSVEKFVPFPNLVGFSPMSGFTGDYITISGTAFSGMSGVFFNNLSGIDFTVINNTGISVRVPSGNTRGINKIIRTIWYYNFIRTRIFSLCYCHRSTVREWTHRCFN